LRGGATPLGVAALPVAGLGRMRVSPDRRESRSERYAGCAPTLPIVFADGVRGDGGGGGDKWYNVLVPPGRRST
jgi:hypothetical protein